MGLVKGRPTTPKGKPRRANCEELKASLDAPDAAIRRHSALEILRCPGAVHSLATRLNRENDVAVREAILVSMAQIDDSEVVSELVECLRSEDAALCNEAIETLKHLTTDVSPALKSLLSDLDPDLRIFAVNILESRCDPNVEQMLIGVIEQDINVNVCATAIDLLCELGTEAALDPILRLKKRFPSEAYLQFAADLALKRIRGI